MHYIIAPKFPRSVRAIRDAQRCAAVYDAMANFIGCFKTGLPPPGGLGLRRLRGEFWEIRSGISDRIVFSWHGDTIRWLLVGNHDDIRRFLKSS